MAGGYRYPERAFDVEQSKARPVKDEHSHVQDALQYVVGGFYKTQNKSGYNNVPELRYNSYSENKVKNVFRKF